MSKPNNFTKEKNVVVSASIGYELYNKTRALQQAGVEEAFWSNAMRRGLKQVIDMSEGFTLPEEAIERLKKRIIETLKENEELKERLKNNGMA